MTKRRYIMGTLALAMVLTAGRATPAFERVISSAQSFQESFRDLKGASASLNPVERFVFSLVLSNTKPGHHT